jgi:hypothetical protein
MMTLKEQYVIDTEGNKTAVILSLQRYEQLMEDLHDLAVVAERREEKPISLEEMKRRLREDGLPVALTSSLLFRKTCDLCLKHSLLG